ncbi:MAG: Transposase IS4 [Comamonadaceae bacterium]|nr:MAG: Transposase IS4 [Comamonadaceae bacterium]
MKTVATCARTLPQRNVNRLRRFTVGVLRLFGDTKTSSAKKMTQLNRNTRMVFDYLRMTKTLLRNFPSSLLVLVLPGLDKGLPLGQHEINQSCQFVRTGRDGLGFVHARTQSTVMSTQCGLTFT